MGRIAEKDLEILQSKLKGDLQWDNLTRIIYATDASIYRETPDAVAFPESSNDIIKLISFAIDHNCPLIPRAAGTSLAGQCVGEGIVVDVSRYMTEILELNVEEKWVRVQPGVIRDQLNAYLKPHGLQFGPNTSTANRAMIGGMVGNNSCGSSSIVYGTTRDKTIELRVVLSDGSKVRFGNINREDFSKKCSGTQLESKIYKMIWHELSQESARNEIKKEFPKESIHRRNTGYAVDELIDQQPFNETGGYFNMCSLLCGSEGTLAFTTDIKLSLDPLAPKYNALVCPHFGSVRDALQAVLAAMRHNLYACELMDKFILDCARRNKEQAARMNFIDGDPGAILMLEVAADTREELDHLVLNLRSEMTSQCKASTCTVLYGDLINDAWEVRKAGLGVLSNIPGDKKAIACIEDTAVALDDLPEYISEFTKMMDGYGQEAVYYAHAGAGELHLRPMLDLKSDDDLKVFRSICQSSAALVKKYRGSLSGEHGDGRVRAEFIKDMVGDANYSLFERIKSTWDPNNILNPGKIVNAKPIDTDLRFDKRSKQKEPNTFMDFSEDMGMLRAAEKCNGSGDCRKLSLSGGGMCPSYRATKNEKDTTRARANALREILINSDKKNAFDSEELKEVMDLCISCKACANECPSNVDMASLKAEFLHQYYKSNKTPLRSRLIANSARLNKIGKRFATITNWIVQSNTVKSKLGFSKKRRLPEIQGVTLRAWIRNRNANDVKQNVGKRLVYLFVDEFSNYYDVEVGKKAYLLLLALNYDVRIARHRESGRAAISKGMLKRAKALASNNVKRLSPLINDDVALVGIEPSAILGFRDEYPKLLAKSLKAKSIDLAKNCFTIEEFISKELASGFISSDQFTDREKQIYVHIHCHQKALSKVSKSVDALSIPVNYTVNSIKSGCCGMAGSFGYEKEHHEVSMAMGELALFPAVREVEYDALIAAAGTSCRHQILDGTGRASQHPVEILYDALLTSEPQAED